eukprot:scaffold10199_cov146-Cylindrotheca_fusiformis.AAC.32
MTNHTTSRHSLAIMVRQKVRQQLLMHSAWMLALFPDLTPKTSSSVIFRLTRSYSKSYYSRNLELKSARTHLER